MSGGHDKYDSVVEEGLKLDIKMFTPSAEHSDIETVVKQLFHQPFSGVHQYPEADVRVPLNESGTEQR